MPATYTPLLRLTKPGLGDTGWGTTVNDGTTELVDTSVAGTASVDVTSGNVTLTTANGATDQARHMFLRVFGASVAREVLVPATSKLYFVVNECTAAVTVKVSGQTGVAIPASSTAVVRCNGTDVVTSLSYAPSLTLGAALAAASGGTGQASYTTGDLLYATGSTALSKLGIGTNGQILTSTGTAPQWDTLSGVAVTTFSAGTTGFTPNSATSGAVTLAGTLATTNGGTGLTSFTANGVVYASSTSALATGSALTFDGSKLNNSSGSSAGIIQSTDTSGSGNFVRILADASFGSLINFSTGSSLRFATSADNFGSFSEQMRLTSTGLGIGGTPDTKLTVTVADAVSAARFKAATGLMRFRPYVDATNGAILDSTNAAENAYLPLTLTGSTLRLFGNNGAGAVVDSSGNLGIGTSSPAYKLDVRGLITGGNGTIIGGISYSTRPEIGALSNHPCGFITNNMTQMLLDTSGNLGIGATNPSAYGKLAVVGAGVTGHFDSTSGAGGVTFYESAVGRGGIRTLNGSNGLAFLYGTTPGMTLDSSGNLGLGVTPSAWQSDYRVLQISTYGTFYGRIGTNEAGMLQNIYRDSAANFKFLQNGYGASYSFLSGGGHAWYNYGNNVSGAGAAASPTQAMTLDASGNLGVGETSTSGARLWVNSGATQIVANFNSTAATGGYVRFQSSGTSYGDIGTAAEVVGGSASDFGINARGARNLIFGTNNTERARITSGGNFVLGSGEGTATPSSFNYFRAPDAAGTNIAGAGLFINAGNGTGTGGSGSIYLQTAKADSSGSSANSMATVLEITPEGNAKFGPVLGQNYVSANGDFRLQNTSYLRIGHGDATNGIVGGYNIYLSSGTPKYENTSGSSPLSGIYYKSDGTLNFYAGPSASGNTNATERAKIPANGGMVVGTAALATTATDGFLYVPTCAGTPTGTPTTQTGTAPIVVDTTNNKLYFYSGGQWRDAGP